MKFIETKLPGAFIVELERHEDERGFFARAFCREEFEAHGLNGTVVQANASGNPVKGTLRGMHFQRHPHEEVKMIRCTRGAVYDVIIDLREDSRTHRQWTSVELSADNGKMLYVPEGFAHGYLTLEPDSDLFYLMTQFYTPGSAGGVRYDDPAFNVEWPAGVRIEMMSDADRNWPDYRS
ncbi:MAG: dTDP-4-dehydrorhamnose 3,5-epimerase [Acidobacteriota bacterium]|nr:dTDP-4-dehydrorhamnose 3,5-epimerase [Acidobacteriota bacterium]MDH3524786.1 dTDP-4-dehydrorhamnose 3,5-epimerase [Acidobacteriota bacterium]